MAMPVTKRPAGSGAVPLVLGISACEIGASLVVGLTGRLMWGALLAGLGLAIALRWVRRYQRLAGAGVAAEIAAAKLLVADGRTTVAWNRACAAAQAAPGRDLRNAALVVMAGIAIDDRDHRTAREVVARMVGPVDPLLVARIACVDGDLGRAIEVLEAARGRPSFGAAAARRLIELHAEVDDLKRAVQVALDHLELMNGEDLRNMLASLEAWGDAAGAARLAGALAAHSPPAAREPPLGGSPEPQI